MSRIYFNIRVKKVGEQFFLPLKDQIFEEFDLGIAISDFADSFSIG